MATSAHTLDLSTLPPEAAAALAPYEGRRVYIRRTLSVAGERRLRVLALRGKMTARAIAEREGITERQVRRIFASVERASQARAEGQA